MLMLEVLGLWSTILKAGQVSIIHGNGFQFIDVDSRWIRTSRGSGFPARAFVWRRRRPVYQIATIHRRYNPVKRPVERIIGVTYKMIVFVYNTLWRDAVFSFSKKSNHCKDRLIFNGLLLIWSLEVELKQSSLFIWCQSLTKEEDLKPLHGKDLVCPFWLKV
jgi:hypothetical protein